MGELYDQVVDFHNLYSSFIKAFRGKKNDPEAARFHFELEKNLFRLRDELSEHKYHPGKYRYFRIRVPKRRIISVAPFRDRVVHHALVNVIEPIFEKVFIDSSFACLKDKGTHRAVMLAQKYLKINQFYLKLDIEKYFDNIDHKKLVEIFSDQIEDEEIIRLLKTILKTSEQSSGVKGKGIPIGNLTSQFLANVYLDKLDHFVQEQLLSRYYIRYMDDFVLFDNEKERLKRNRDQIREFIESDLLLKLKERAVIIQRRENGLGFLGYRLFPGVIRVKNKNIRRLKRKVYFREYQSRSGQISDERLVASVQSIMGYFNFADTAGLKKSIFHSGYQSTEQ